MKSAFIKLGNSVFHAQYILISPGYKSKNLSYNGYSLKEASI